MHRIFLQAISMYIKYILIYGNAHVLNYLLHTSDI